MTVDSYMDNLLPDQNELLAKVRRAIKAACPGAEEIFKEIEVKSVKKKVNR